MREKIQELWSFCNHECKRYLIDSVHGNTDVGAEREEWFLLCSKIEFCLRNQSCYDVEVLREKFKKIPIPDKFQKRFGDLIHI